MSSASRSSSGAGWQGLLRWFGVGVALAIVSGCTQELRMQPASIVLEKTMGPPITLQASAIGSSSEGYARTLKRNSSWRKIGTIRQGDILKPLDTTLTAEAIHVREAYIVVKQNRWVGFWLPVEKAFSPLDAATQIKFSKGG